MKIFPFNSVRYGFVDCHNLNSYVFVIFRKRKKRNVLVDLNWVVMHGCNNLGRRVYSKLDEGEAARDCATDLKQGTQCGEGQVSSVVAWRHLQQSLCISFLVLGKRRGLSFGCLWQL